MRASHHPEMQHAGTYQVIEVLAAAGEERFVLFAADRLTDQVVYGSPTSENEPTGSLAKTLLRRARASGRFSSATGASTLAATTSTIAKKSGIGGLDSPDAHLPISAGVLPRNRASCSTPSAISIARDSVRV